MNKNGCVVIIKTLPIQRVQQMKTGVNIGVNQIYVST